jgi:hypothetical protein
MEMNMRKMFLSCMFAFSFTCGVTAFAMEAAEIVAEIRTSSFPEEDKLEIDFYSSRRPVTVVLERGQINSGGLYPTTYGATLFINKDSVSRRQVYCTVEEGARVSDVVVDVIYNYRERPFVSALVVDVKYHDGKYTCHISQDSRN